MHQTSFRSRSGGAILLCAAVLATLSLGGSAGAQSDDGTAPDELMPLTVGLGYVQSVQFAQFYLADVAGYYEAAGLDVTFQNKVDPQLIRLLGQGSIDIGMADGTSLIPAVSQGIPVVYGATIYGRFPSVVFANAETGIEEVADLAGRRVGTPGRFGSSWVMLQALLASAGLTTEDIEVRTYPEYGQGVAVAEGQVDAATGFVNNEPVKLRLEGMDVNILSIDGVAPLPGPGLVVGTKTLETKPEALRAFTAATLRAMDEIAADPQLGLDATFQVVPLLADEPDVQSAILQATIDTWLSEHAATHGFGAIDREAWDSALSIMRGVPDSLVADTLTVDQLVTDALLP